MSVEAKTGERRITFRCDLHADELRAKVERQPAPVAARPAKQAMDPVALALDPALPPKPKRAPLLFDIPEGAQPVPCSTCADTVVWIITRAGKRMPVEAFGEHRGQSHFIFCKHADYHRKPR